MSTDQPARRSAFTILIVFACALGGGLWLAWSMYMKALDRAARTTVVWISIDGFRGDYSAGADLPFFQRLRREAFWTAQLAPVFPSITFPSHCSLATGVSVERHGITANSFYDTSTKTQYGYPNDASLLQAEPIWLTAQRQGVSTVVLDWPLSHSQKGPVRTTFFGERFDGSLADEVRLNNVLESWENVLKKPGARPVHLVMGYIIATDKPGHDTGPQSEETRRMVQQTDELLSKFVERARAVWQKQRKTTKDRLVFVFSADHGMSPVTRVANFERILGVPRRDPSLKLTTTGNVGHIFLDSQTFPAGSPERAKRAQELLDRLKAADPGIVAVRREEAPKDWGYAHPTRCGDLIVVLPRGMTFTWEPADEAIVAVRPGSRDPRGMHGWDVRENPEMLGFLAFWDPAAPAGRDLGPVLWNQVHPTVASLLRVLPAQGANGTALPLEAPR